jgi:DNA-directed RNA polymerase alpha subunit
MPKEYYQQKSSSFDSDAPGCDQKASVSSSLIQRFREAINRLDENIEYTDKKLYAISSYSELCAETENELAKAPNNFLDELDVLINRLNALNTRMESANRHLNEII